MIKMEFGNFTFYIGLCVILYLLFYSLAIMVLDFHDMCQGAHQQPSGVTALAFKLLEQKGYRVLAVPYNEFNTSEKLLKRVQYLEGKLKRIINTKN